MRQATPEAPPIGAPLFRPLRPDAAMPVTLFFQGRRIGARAGDSVAAALLRAGIRAFRHTPESGAPRLPFCMIGHCFECLVEIDGTANRQACLTPVAEGMRVRLQDGAGRVGE